MELDEQETELLNSVCENGDYLEDADDDVRGQVSDIIRDVPDEPLTQLDPLLLSKLFTASRQLLGFRENELELFYDELRLKENRLAELEMRTPKKTDDDRRYAKDLEDEIQQMQVDHANELQRLQQQLESNQQHFGEEKRRLEREKDDALKLAQEHIREQSSQAVLGDNVEALSAEIKRKRDEINHLLDTNARVEDENRALTRMNEENQTKMAEAAEYMSELTEKYKKMEDMVTSRDVKSEEVTMDIERKDAEVKRLKDEIRKKDQEADAIFDEVTQRTEQFMALNELKETELERQRKIIEQHERQKANDQLTPDKQLVKQLQDELDMAKKNYVALELEMRDATQHMEHNNELITGLTSSSSPEMQIQTLMGKYEHLNLEHAKLHQQHEATIHTLSQTEIHLREIEDQLSRERKLRHDIESGIVGVPELRDTVAKLEKKLAQRETERERLTQGIGSIDDQLLLMMAENDRLRADLGLGQRDDTELAQLRHDLQINSRAQKADLCFLERQVDQLEDERIRLKRELRIQTQSVYQRCQEYGLTPEQFEQVCAFILKLGGHVDKVDYTASVGGSDIQQQTMRTSKTHDNKFRAKYEEEKHQNDILHLKLAQASKDIDQFKKATPLDSDQLRHLLKAVKSDSELNQHQNPSLDKLTAFLGGEQLLGEKIDHLSHQIEHLATSQALEQTSTFTLTNYEVLRSEIDMLREEQTAKQAAYDELKATVATKDVEFKKATNELENKENVWNGEKHLIDEKLAKMQLEQENAIEEQTACRIHLEEFAKLRQSLTGAGDEQKEYLAECITTLTSVRIELQKQKRANRLAKHDIEAVKRKNQTLEKEIADSRGKFRAETRQIETIRRTYHQQLASVKADLEGTVPRAHYNTLEKRLIDQAKQLRELTETNHDEKVLRIKLSEQTNTIDIISREKEALVREMKTLTEKCVKLEEQIDGDKPGAKTTEMSARKKVAILEIAELNERQKADHAKRDNEKLLVTVKVASERIKELEANLDILAKKNLEQHDVEDGLRQRLHDSVGTEEYKAHMVELCRLREELIEANNDRVNYKALAELEHSQAERLQAEIKTLKDRESLMATMLDESSVLESDPTAQLMLLKKEVQQLNELNATIDSRNAFLKEVNDELSLKVLQSEKQLDQKDALLLLLIRAENKRSHLIAQQLGELKSRYAGSVPIDQLQRHHVELDDVRDKQLTLTSELEQVRKSRAELEGKIGEYRLKHINMEEMANALKHGVVEQKLIKWQQNAETAKLNELKLRRHIGQFETENALLKAQLTKRGDQMGQLERELGAANQRAVSIDVLRAQHDAIVDELKRNLETDNEVRRQTRQMTLDSSTKHEGDLTRNRELTGLKASLAGMMNQFNQLKTDYNKVKTTLLDKEKKLVEQEQLVGEYRLKLDQVKSRHFKDDQSVQRAKQELTSDMMGFADLSSQLVVLEQRAANAEARLTSKTQESG